MVVSGNRARARLQYDSYLHADPMTANVYGQLQQIWTGYIVMVGCHLSSMEILYGKE